MGSVGLFLFCFCLTLLVGQARLHPDCPKWLRPVPEEVRKKNQQMSKGAIGLLFVGLVIGLMLHFMT